MIHRPSNASTYLHNYAIIQLAARGKLATGKLRHLSNDRTGVHVSPPENSNLPSSLFYAELKLRF